MFPSISSIRRILFRLPVALARALLWLLRAAHHFSPRLFRHLRRALRWLVWVLLAGYLAFALLLLVLRYAVLPHINDYQTQIEAAASRAAGLTVQIAAVDADWRGFQPNLTLRGVTVFDPQQRRALHLPKISATVSWQSLFVLELRLAQLHIEGADLEVRRRADGHVLVAGIDTTGTEDGHAAEWLLRQQRVSVHGARVRWVDEERRAPELPLEALDFVMENGLRHHRFVLQATPPAALGGRMDVRGDFTHPLFTEQVADYRRWDGLLYLDLQMPDLTAAKPYVDYPIPLLRGGGALRAWLDFEALKVRQFTADLALEQVSTRLRHDLAVLGLERVQGRLRAVQEGGAELGAGLRYGVELQHFSLRTAEGLTLRNVNLSHHYNAAQSGTPERGDLALSEIDLRTLAQLAGHLPLHARVRQWLDAYAPRGKLTQLKARWQGDPLAAQGFSYQVSTGFSGVGIREQAVAAPPAALPETKTADKKKRPPVSRRAASATLPAPVVAVSTSGSALMQIGVPGFDNLSGQIEVSQAGGTLELDSREASVTFPGVFEEPRIPVQRLKGKIGWKKEDGHYLITLKQMAFSNEDAAGQLAGTYRYDGHGPGVADLQGSLTRGQGVRVARYLPLWLPATRQWVAQAVKGGVSNDVQFVLQGNLHDFPFKDPALGQFRVGIKVRQGAVQAGPGWPVLENAQGEVIFERQSLRANLKEATISGLPVNAGDMAIADLSHPVLKAQGKAQGPLQNVLHFVNQSPVSAQIDHFTDALQATGNVRTEVQLELPLEDTERVKVRGALVFSNNDVTLEGASASLALQHLQGRMEFTERSLNLRSLSGTFLGGALKLDGNTRAGGDTVIRVDGQLSAAGLQYLMPELLARQFTGATRYGGAINLRKGVVQLQLDSNLKGLGINLPTPLRKSAADSWNFRLENRPSASAESATQKRGGEWRAVLERDGQTRIETRIEMRSEPTRHATDALVLKRGVVAINENAVLPDSGLALHVNLPVVEIDAWRALLGDTTATADNTDADYLPDQVTLRSDAVTVFGRKMQHVTLGAVRHGKTWQANLDADLLSGFLTWQPEKSGSKLMAHLTRLEIPQSVAQPVSSVLTDLPDDVPALDLTVDDFTLTGKRLGRLELAASNAGVAGNPVWQLHKLRLSNLDASFAATGSWARDGSASASKKTPAARKMALNFTLDVINAGKLLERFGQKDTVSNGEGKLEGVISWRGSPFAIDYPSLSGKIMMGIDKGQFLKADPGIAKLIGVLSLQALPRRISLDFRDVFSDGFGFDTVRASIDVNNGIAATRDFKMKGVAATVVMEGEVDLSHETQQLHLLVLPSVSSSVSGLALLANPAIGVVTWLAQTILKDPLSKILAYEYDVSGSWAEPNVVKREQKAPAAHGAGEETGK